MNIEINKTMSNPFNKILHSLLIQIKESDPKIYESILENGVNGNLQEHTEKTIIAVLQHVHALSENNAPISNNEFIEKLQDHLTNFDDANNMALGISNVATVFALILENKAEKVGGVVQEHYKNLVEPFIVRLNKLTVDIVIESMTDDSQGVELALSVIRETNPEVANAISDLLENDQLAFAIIKSLEAIVYEARDVDVTEKLDKFINTSKSLHSQKKSHFSIIFGFMPTAFAKLNPFKDEAHEQRTIALIQTLYEFGERLSQTQQQNETSPPDVQKSSENYKADGKLWVNYSGFHDYEIHEVAQVAFSEEKLDTYKSDFKVHEHKAILNVHFGEFASSLSMHAVNQYETWASGDQPEKNFVKSLEYFEKLTRFVADGKDESSENKVQRLAFLGAMLAYTIRNTPNIGKRSKEKVDSLSVFITERLESFGIKLESPQKTTNLFGMLDTLLGTK